MSNKKKPPKTNLQKLEKELKRQRKLLTKNVDDLKKPHASAISKQWLSAFGGAIDNFCKWLEELTNETINNTEFPNSRREDISEDN